MMIYCVEDDQNIRELIVYTLQNSGFEARGFENSKELYREFNEKLPELILLDIMLPHEDGIEILKNIRRGLLTKNVPVILLTAKSSEFDRIVGLDSGADDYITKPFSMMELIARIKAVLRRGKINDEDIIMHGPLTIDLPKHVVYLHGRKINLTLKEFDLLHTLMNSIDTVMTRDVLLEKIWGYNFDGETRTVDVHIRSLRKKLEEAGNLIETIHGVGYKIGRYHEK